MQRLYQPPLHIWQPRADVGGISRRCVVAPPEAACAVACDAVGGVAVLAPDTAHRGPEASLNVAACYNLGCPAACVVPGEHLCQQWTSSANCPFEQFVIFS